MAIPISPRRLTFSVVIIVLILQEIAAQPDSPGDYGDYSVADNVSEPIIQQDQTTRVDPLDNFKMYRGGFNMTNKHYWSSVVFTGIYGYAIGVIWLLCGVFFLTIHSCCQSDGGRRNNKILHSNFKSCNVLPIPLAIMLMLLAMVASGVVLVGSAKFHSQARTSIDIIIKTANDGSEIIHNATGALQNIQDSVESDVGSEASGNLNFTADYFNDAAENILNKARKNRHIINKDFKVVFVITVVIISLNLIAVTTLSVSGVLRFWKAVYLFVLLCWLMTVICWLLFGVYFFLENFSNDACTALLNFQENPSNNSLSSILPCDEFVSVLSEIGEGIYNLIDEVNSNIANLQGILLPDFFNVCNPFSKPPKYLYQPENCAADTIQIRDIPKVLWPYTCFDDDYETCSSQDFITSSDYGVLKSYTGSIQNLLNVYPSMEYLLGCQLVKDAFSQVLLKHCKPLKKYARMTWLGMVCLATIMVFLVVLWTIKALHEQSYHLSDGSTQPHSVTGNA